MTDQPEVVCAGIVVADHVCTPVARLPAAGELVLAERILLTIGGCAANVAVDLSKMGVRASVAGCVGGDPAGRVVTEMLRGHHLDVSGLRVCPETDTSQTLIVNVAGEDRRFIHSFGANSAFCAADIPAGPAASAKVLYLGGYLLMPRLLASELAAVFAAARRGGGRTVLDVVTPGPADYLSHLKPLLPHVDVFLPNTDEAALITGVTDPVRQAELFHGLGAGTVVITRGGAGAVLVSDQARLKAGAYPVPFVDGSGGGDAFAAGYICGLLRGMAPADCLRVASALGASCVRATGTTEGVFNQEECAAFLAEHTLLVEAI